MLEQPPEPLASPRRRTPAAESAASPSGRSPVAEQAAAASAAAERATSIPVQPAILAASNGGPSGRAGVAEEIRKEWYILKVQSNREESIREGLMRRVAMAGLDRFFGDCIVPTEMVSEFKGGKKRISKRKLYPGYLVVHMEINDDTWYLVRETPGIGDFTGSIGRPSPMLAQDVQKILAKSEEKTDEAPEAQDQLQEGRSRQNQRRHLRELRRRCGHHRRGEWPGDRDDQYLRPFDAGRIGILANRIGIARSLASRSDNRGGYN